MNVILNNNIVICSRAKALLRKNVKYGFKIKTTLQLIDL